MICNIVVAHFYIVLFSTLKQTHCAHMWFYMSWHGWCHMKLLPSQCVLCTPYIHAPCHFMQRRTGADKQGWCQLLKANWHYDCTDVRSCLTLSFDSWPDNSDKWQTPETSVKHYLYSESIYIHPNLKPWILIHGTAHIQLGTPKIALGEYWSTIKHTHTMVLKQVKHWLEIIFQNIFLSLTE